ncbi:hypothetical protein SISNIDRAFT_482298 [Sistotremastrum niveocremeum HHB9708]|uniref:RNA polymerase II-associated protein 1 C-terminal domain-containing protein n=1 Tax=Sistotremastrum niveocremeum HHB9708 TaxID=1314777 RepID=A0A164YZH1_9AGAM|nr:hypothetical protein SISNIDRAFT_482298 [Sistotremastrum niveocremeum HHB9708]
MTSLVGDIVERKSGSTSSNAPHTRPTGTNTTGFPLVQHRSQSAFSRARQAAQRNPPTTSVPRIIPVASTTGNSKHLPPPSDDIQSIQSQISEENERRVAAMSPQEREQEIDSVKEHLGVGIEDMIRKMQEARKRRRLKQELEDNKRPSSPLPDFRDDVPTEPSSESIDIESHIPTSPTQYPVLQASLKSAVAIKRLGPPEADHPDRPSSTPPRMRKLRFADPKPSDIHVYESAPSSPRRVMGLLPLPDESDRAGPSSNVVQLPTLPFSSLRRRVPQPQESQESPSVSGNDTSDGTPEHIRAQYFPEAPSDDPSLAWIRNVPSSVVSSSSGQPEELRFDLQGRTLSAEDASALPTHLGLHHHSNPSQLAGYTLADLLHLSRSTVPSQRSTMLTVLSRILRRERLSEDTFKKIFAVGLEASQVGTNLNVCTSGVELLWSALVKSASPVEESTLKGIPTESVISLFADHLSSQVLPMTSLLQILETLLKLVTLSPDLCASLLSIPQLLPLIVRVFLPPPIGNDGPSAEVNALRLFHQLARSSRANAEKLSETADAALRFLVIVPETPSAQLLAAETLTFYSILGRYGLYAHIAATANAHISKLGNNLLIQLQSGVHSPPLEYLAEAWLHLLECWIVCAIDPHQTSPPHEILWTQISNWEWGETILELLLQSSSRLGVVWTAACRALSAWLDGAAVNSPRNGEQERTLVYEKLRHAISDGDIQDALQEDVNSLMISLRDTGRDSLSLTEERSFDRLSATLKLVLSTHPPFGSDTETQTALDLPITFTSMQALADLIVDASSIIPSPRTAAFLQVQTRLRRRLRRESDMEWLSFAMTLPTSVPLGEEEFIAWLFDQIAILLTKDLASALSIPTPPDMWDGKGIETLLPFLVESLYPSEIRLAPFFPTPESLKFTLTQCNSPSPSARIASLPAPRSWPLWPLDHLLRSGTSQVFRKLPPSWDASETDVVRASLVLCLVSQKLVKSKMPRSEAMFGCMKIFMLEHEQPNDASTSEVYRDKSVESSMRLLLNPYTWANRHDISEHSDDLSLEDAAKAYLGASTPFYQFYSDFLALYDAISFGHDLFGTLLLGPISQRYPRDYRKLLIGDHRHVLRYIRTEPGQVLSGDLSAYLYPVETNGESISLFLGALTLNAGLSGLEGFLRLIAVHHVSCNIWPDLRHHSGSKHGQDDQDAKEQERARRLLGLVSSQARAAVVRDVVRYRQMGPEVDVLLSPDCFDAPNEVVEQRRAWLRSIDSNLAERLNDHFSVPSV